MAVPFAVAKSTLVVNPVDPVFVTANENVELPAFPSAAVTSPMAKEAELSSSAMVCVAVGVSITTFVEGWGFEMVTVNVSFFEPSEPSVSASTTSASWRIVLVANL